MKKFIFVYYGSNDHKEMDKDAMQAIMDKWMGWFDTFKDQIVDGGNPFVDNGMSVTGNGVESIPADMWPATGYTIINAEDMDAATEIAKACPCNEKENGAVRVYEALPM